jgi:ABC-type polar amino acid transport system ATPase subunit
MDGAAMSEAALQVSGLSKRYGAVEVLRNINLSLPPGGTLALLGRSGSGKSTLLKCLNLLETPDAGELRLAGQRYCIGSNILFEPWEIRREIGLVLQDYSLFPNMTVAQNLDFALRNNNSANRRDSLRRVEELAFNLEIEDLLARYPASLSGGQAQRCTLARALVLRPKILLLDEITSALDPESIQNVIGAIECIRNIASNQRMAIILVTHLVRFAVSFADEIAYLNGGCIVEQHSSTNFVESVRHSEAQRFVEAHLHAPT